MRDELGCQSLRLDHVNPRCAAKRSGGLALLHGAHDDLVAATLTGAQVLAALVSPLPLLILGGIVVAVWVPIAVLLLTPMWSICPDRNQRATAMVDRVLAAIPGSRDATPPTGPTDVSERADVSEPADSDARPPRRPWRWCGSRWT